jgi:energy-coupling factor transporter transmembrane protein EcfT
MNKKKIASFMMTLLAIVTVLLLFLIVVVVPKDWVFTLLGWLLIVLAAINLALFFSGWFKES